MSRASVVNHITKLATNVVGNSHFSTVQSGFSDRKTDLATRISFKVRLEVDISILVI